MPVGLILDCLLKASQYFYDYFSKPQTQEAKIEGICLVSGAFFKPRTLLIQEIDEPDEVLIPNATSSRK